MSVLYQTEPIFGLFFVTFPSSCPRYLIMCDLALAGFVRFAVTEAGGSVMSNLTSVSSCLIIFYRALDSSHPSYASRQSSNFAFCFNLRRELSARSSIFFDVHSCKLILCVWREIRTSNRNIFKILRGASLASSLHTVWNIK